MGSKFGLLLPIRIVTQNEMANLLSFKCESSQLLSLDSLENNSIKEV